MGGIQVWMGEHLLERAQVLASPLRVPSVPRGLHGCSSGQLTSFVAVEGSRFCLSGWS
jgi:hypothetical protein